MTTTELPLGDVVTVAHFATQARDGLFDERRHDSVRRVLDVVGNSVAAASVGADAAISTVVRSWGGAETSSAIGHSIRYPAPMAALVNGTLAHALDFDDTHYQSVLHPSASVVPAALAAAEAAGASGAEFLDAITVGNEILVRLGMAGYDPDLGNSIFFERGQHATAICGAVASAITASMLYGLDTPGIASAAGIAASMGAGLLEANRSGGTVKRLHCGWAAKSGVSAAEFARAGITGPPTVLEGRFGFFQAWCGSEAHPDVVTADLGTHWESAQIAYKPYPCNGFTHAAIDAALHLRAQGLLPSEIVDMELGVPTAVLRTIAQPAAVKAAPPTGYAAAFSGPYAVAAALTDGGGLGVWLDDFTDAAAIDPARRALAAMVRCVADPHCDSVFPHQFPAVLRVTTRDGRTWEARVDTNRGGPLRPLDDHEFTTKFRMGVTRSLTDSRTSDLEDEIRLLPERDTVGRLAEVLRHNMLPNPSHEESTR